jgi:RNA polymerase sigma-70 factor (ECF subfamily)
VEKMSDQTVKTGSSREEMSASLIGILPDMRAFARSLTKERILADDLVQDAAVRALTSAHLYMPGTNFKAWVFTIIRNCFYNDIRLRQRQTTLPENLSDWGEQGNQEVPLTLCDFRRAFWQLSFEHREVLMLIGPSSLSYEEAAAVCGCAIGTVKSRVSRARAELHRILDTESLGMPRRDAAPVSAGHPEQLAVNFAWLAMAPAKQDETVPARNRPRLPAR